MKKKIPLLLASISLFSICLINCGGSKPSYTKENKKVNYLYFESGTEVLSDVVFFSHRPNVTYIPISEYKNFVPSFTMSVKRNGSNYTFTNLLNYEKAVLNADSGELTYDSYSKFTTNTDIPHEEIHIDLLANQKVTEESSYKQGNKYTINLSDYNLAPIKSNNEYYLPIDVLMRIDPLTGKGTAYFDGENRVTLLYNDDISKYVELGYKTITSYPKEFYEYNYDLFTFDVDLIYGLNGYSRPMRHDNNKIFTFNKDGARKTFEKYKENIVKDQSTKDFDIAFDKMFDEIDDGGHTVIEGASIATKFEDLPADFSKHKERSYTNDALNLEKSKRSDEIKNTIIRGYDTDSDGHDDIGYFTIDAFNISIKEDSLHVTIPKANQQFNRNLNDEAKYIKDIVIDLGLNRGGATAGEGMLLSWICNGKAKQVLKDARDGSITTSVYKYDFNGDKEFNEKDFIPSDVNIYILTDASFSAGAALPFDTYMYTLSDEYKKTGQNIKFIGKPHLGGACSITGSILMPTGFTYHMSSNSVGINWYDNSKTSDEIMPITNGWELTVDQIVDRTTLNNKIKDARGGK